MKNKTNIAMRCDKDQFEAIKPKLEKNGKIGRLRGAFEEYCYLTNNYDYADIFDFIGNDSYWYGEHGGNIHEQWNEKVFLEACGIETTPTIQEVKEYFKDAEIVECLYSGKNENISKDITETFNYCSCSYFIRTEKSLNGDGSVELWNPDKGYAKIITKKSPEYTITRERVLQAVKKNPCCAATEDVLKELFPQAFEEEKVELPNDFTGWCKCDGSGNEKWIGKFEKGIFQYGIGADGKWFENKITFHNFKINSSNIEATPQEVEQALKNEAVKRGFVEGSWVKTVLGNVKTISGNIEFRLYSNKLLSINDPDERYALLFENGNWASVIPTKTKEEAEKLLNCKIVN